MNSHKFYLNKDFYIKLIEFPALYNIKTDELYCLDDRALDILKNIDNVDIDILDNSDKEFIDFCLKEGILIENPQGRIRTKLKQSPIPSLRYLELQITKRCNLKCKHCFLGDTENVDLPLEKIRKILKEFEEMQGLRVLITGGEALLHPKFSEINEFLKEVAIRKILFTNGNLLDDGILKNLNVEEIQISIDGMKSGHEKLRGVGTFEKALSSLRKAIDYGFQVSVATVIHRGNIEEFYELEALIKSLKVREWTVDALTMAGNLLINQEFWVSPEESSKIMNRYGFSLEDHPRIEGYGCGAHLLSISARGFASFCSFYENSPIGSIDQGLEKLWTKKKHVFLRELKCVELSCPFINDCRGGCRYRAKTLSDNENSPDLFKCYQMGFYPLKSSN
ncbi:MAG: radical SAM protein [Thermodesulfovibrio sp.]|uniref:radical SAM protein n=1 Tax=unclassified Thermodesulfovibrio TaxID=2645936 RepID=UPI00083A5931|nr:MULTISPECIES: radical SAM protein [unclassified Thermodesulfovibrio]MDI1471369.1 radical SAM protein [Thermodesulfovibrio sp. 1176]MDI6714604.1 radical SAM protein [Thermodesulfovibrio sp.]ODA44322.1 radical SAM domain protein [Thermodesulfovibrio sp. N1]